MRAKRDVEKQAWINMIHRCHNPESKSFHNYGERGISVCPQWRSKETGFQQFIADMGRKPDPKLWLDRIDVDGDYEPSNCRWATISEQMANRRPRKHEVFNELIYIDGVGRTAGDWSRISGVSGATIAARVRNGRFGQDIIAPGRLARRDTGLPKASHFNVYIRTPSPPPLPFGNRLLTIGAQTLKMSEWAQLFCAELSLVENRHRNGWHTEGLFLPRKKHRRHR